MFYFCYLGVIRRRFICNKFSFRLSVGFVFFFVYGVGFFCVVFVLWLGCVGVLFFVVFGGWGVQAVGLSFGVLYWRVLCWVVGTGCYCFELFYCYCVLGFVVWLGWESGL